jgi:hypothetical protein
VDPLGRIKLFREREKATGKPKTLQKLQNFKDELVKAERIFGLCATTAGEIERRKDLLGRRWQSVFDLYLTLEESARSEYSLDLEARYADVLGYDPLQEVSDLRLAYGAVLEDVASFKGQLGAATPE